MAYTRRMSARLLACPACSRHIRLTETRCPFCGVTCPDSFASTPAPVPPPDGLSRAERSGYARTAARVAATVGSGAAIAIALSCSRDDDNERAFYGAPPPNPSHMPIAARDAAPPDAAAGDRRSAGVSRGRWIGPKGVSAVTYLTKIVVQGLGGTVKKRAHRRPRRARVCLVLGVQVSGLYSLASRSASG
jgi:hypothetical protein